MLIHLDDGAALFDIVVQSGADQKKTVVDSCGKDPGKGLRDDAGNAEF